MRTQAQSPQFLAEACCFFFEKTRQLDLESFNVRLCEVVSRLSHSYELCGSAYKTGILEKIEAKLYYNIVLRAKNLRDLAGNPPTNRIVIVSDADRGVDVDRLLHDLNVNLLHVHFLAKFWRELRPLQELLVHSLGHVDGGKD